MDNILQKKPEDICKDILNIEDNENVKIEVDDKSKSSLYVFLTNTIYIANKEIKTKSKEKQNKSKVLVIAHECAHSLQSKAMQVINFTLSNIEMILFAIILVARIFFEKSDMLVNAYTITAILSIIVRLYLEMDATINSVKITTKYMLKNKVKTKDVKDLVALYKKELLKTMPLFILMLFGFKIIRLIISMVI